MDAGVCAALDAAGAPGFSLDPHAVASNAPLARTTADEWAKSRGPEAVDSLAKARALLGR